MHADFRPWPCQKGARSHFLDDCDNMEEGLRLPGRGQPNWIVVFRRMEFELANPALASRT